MESTEQNIFANISFEQCLSAVITFCKDNSSSFACWRKPNSDLTILVIDFHGFEKLNDIQLENIQPGFILAPFNNNDNQLLIKQDVLIEWGNEPSVVSLNSSNSDKLISFINDYNKDSEPSEFKFKSAINEDLDYQKLVSKSIEYIKEGHFSKVVPSRRKVYEGEFNDGKCGEIFHNLSETYPNAFVSMTYTEATGLWVGASPELLINTHEDIFKTVALAGTQSFDTHQSLAEVAWTQKEIEEQAFVSRYIINCFKKIRLREFDEHGPKTIKAGNLIHLKTDFEVNMQATNFSELGSTMLKLLHPTSAVCGMPKEASLDFLNSYEGYDRELFSGFLGPVNINSESSIYVNLRCMKIESDKIYLFAGAGVTEDSNPEKEAKETEMKMNTILNVISSS